MVELMVGVVLGLLIVGVSAAVFVASRHSFLVQDNAGHMQESARAMLEDITREIRKAGSFGCYRWKDTNNPLFITATLPNGKDSSFPLPSVINADSVVIGGDVSGLTLPSASGITRVSGTDYISLLYGQPVATLKVGKGNGLLEDVEADYPLNRKINVSTGQPMAIADCDSMTIFRVDNNGETDTLAHKYTGGSNARPADILGSDPLLAGNVYRGGAMVMWLELPTFFIGQDVTGTKSLYRWDTSNGGGIQPMIPNVEQMRVVFGVDRASTAGHLNGATEWLEASAVQADNLWGNVVSATVHIVLRSDDQGGAGTTPKDYIWSTSLKRFIEASGTDHFIRQSHVINAALRNRVPIMN